ncbi:MULTISPECIES: HNH endonuclease [Acidiphilium]|uniref:HNH endonuclease n=1 Tax=Acidiphilium TaxID=522 RepID=UPI0009DC9E74|nr:MULTISPECIES: HNH endonuclease signature motif containing protein [Acidiphilium]
MSRERIRQIAAEIGDIEMAGWGDLWPVITECSTILGEMAPIKRRRLMDHVITELYEEQGGTCALCGELLEISNCHRDHRIPFTWGGGNERGNLQLAHPSCNQSKGDSVDLRDLIPYLESRCMNL